MNNRIRYTLDVIRRNTFYQLPKFLFTDEFKGISNDARVLYSLLRDRHELSVKSGWINEQNEVYLIYSRENMCEMLGISRPTITKAMNDLKKYDLIQEERLGQGKVNRIYLLSVNTTMSYEKPFETLENTKKERFFPSKDKDFFLLEGKNLSPINTELSDTYINENIQSTLIKSVLDLDTPQEKIKTETMATQADGSEKKQKKESFPNIQSNQSDRYLAKPSALRYEYNTLLERIKDNIDYEYIIDENPYSEEMLEEICHVITSTILNDYKDGWISMGNERANAEVVRSVFSKLTKDDIDYFLECFNRQTEPIIKMTAYIRTALYRNHRTIGHHMTNRVHTDFPQYAEPKIKSKREF